METILYQLGTGNNYPDENYLSFLKPLLSGRANVKLSASGRIDTVMEVAIKAKQYGTNKVICSNARLLQLLLQSDKACSLDDYAGSIIEKFGVEFLINDPLEHLITVPYGKFVAARYFSKFLEPEKWMQLPEFRWELFEPIATDNVIEFMEKCSFIAVDIETAYGTERAITCTGFTGVLLEAGKVTVRTVVVPMTDMFNYTVTKVLCTSNIPKVFQNGKYDNAYLLRYGIPVHNWCGDTQHMFHSWYSELPKDLGFLTAFMLRKWQYWKDESKTTDLHQYYAYNAKDAYTTAMDWLALMQEVPQFAWNNYVQHEFPLVFPCLLAEMTGLKVDQSEREKEEIRFNTSLAVQLAKIRKMVGHPNFNPSSSDQTLLLFKQLGCGDVSNTTPPSMEKVSTRHSLNKRIVKSITTYRKDRKIATSNLRDYDPKKKKFKVWLNRAFYSLNPGGTDTARLASKESAFWCGWQIHNIPRDRKDIQVKRIFVADDGFLFGEADGEQAEARDVAYLSGDTKLIAAVDDKTKDFHGLNAAAFFGVDYSKIVLSEYHEGTAQWVHKTLDEDLRNLSKRTNHGANYNMGARVLLDTMGIENVLRAKRLLKLPAGMSSLAVCQYLLDTYAKTYPIVKGAYYDKIKADVRGSSMLVSPIGWTRYCFGNPDKSKQDLNAYVAHPSQNLNAGVLNLAWRKVFYEVWMPNKENFKLCTQIHDSILFQYRIGYEHLAWQVKECMEIPILVKDTFGIERVLTVPVALKGDATRWSEIRKMYCPKYDYL